MLFHFNDVYKNFGLQQIFKELNFSVERGTFSILTGPSGSGKTTLFRMLCGIEQPNRGKIVFLGQNLTQHSSRHLKNIGFIFQNPRGLAERSILENVALPLELDGVEKDEREAKAMEWLTSLGLRAKARAAYSQLSGGEIQKVEFARALIRKPRLILADEPTAHLDPIQADMILDILWDHYKDGATVFISTHHPPKFHHPSILRYHIENQGVRQLGAEEVSMPFLASKKSVTRSSSAKEV